jgi:hypothetical protein
LGNTYRPEKEIELYYTSDQKPGMGIIKLCPSGDIYAKYTGNSDFSVVSSLQSVIILIKLGQIRMPTKLELYLAGVEDV